MNTKTMKLATIVKMVGASTVMGAMLIAGGCGSESAGVATVTPPTVVNSNTIPATSVAAGTTAGTIATTAPVTATTAAGTTAMAIPTGTTITAPAGGSFSATNPPAIKVTTFATLDAVTPPADTTFVLDQAAGSVDVQIGSFLNGVTFSQPVNILIPYSNTLSLAGNCDVQVNKNDGQGYKAVTGATCNDTTHIATIPVTNLCTFVLHGHWKKKDGSNTGSTGGHGTSGF